MRESCTASSLLVESIIGEKVTRIEYTKMLQISPSIRGLDNWQHTADSPTDPHNGIREAFFGLFTQ